MANAPISLTLFRGTTFGPLTITCRDSAGELVPLAGWAAYAQARLHDGTVLDLLPSIAADDAAGVVTLAALSWQDTADLPVGTGDWDLILETPQGQRLPPFFGGKFIVSAPSTTAA